MKILSVDDKAENRHLLEAMLTPNGYTVVSATNGIDALEKLRKEPFDAIISDLLMPKMDGFQLLHECKKDPALNKIPFIIYTATYTGKKDSEFGLSLGAIRYIIKPVEPDEFLAMLNEVLYGISKGTLADAIPKITSDATYTTGHIRVLTDKIEKKDRLLEMSQDQYRLLADNVSDVIWLLDVPTSDFVYISPSVFALRGYTPEEVMAQPMSASVTPESYQIIAGNLTERIARFEAGDEPLRVQRNDIDQPRKDGTVVPTEVITTLLVGPNRRVTQVLGVTRDITERKRAEFALKESEQFLDNIVEHIPDMIFVKDAEDLRFVRFNKAGEDLLGYSREEMMGKSDYDFFPKTEADFFTGKDREVLRMNQLKDVPEERIQTRNMGERILHTKKLPIVDEEGIPRYLLGISEDITERKRAEEQITIANRKLALMTDVTYQDIQNKVTALRGYIELGKESVSDTERRSFIEKESKILESIHTLIKHTKDYQQMGIDQSQWIPIENEIRMQASFISRMKNISLDIDLHGLECYTDPLVGRVFNNLIENAVKHGKTLTRISFHCRETPDGVILVCEDDGVGIPLEQKAHIFDRIVGGEGKFGLFFVREFLDMSGMTITETGEPGKGARFEITVPKGAYRFMGTGEK